MRGWRTERFEVLCRTVHSGLPYISVVDSWQNYDGAVALAYEWAKREYPYQEVRLLGENVVVRYWENSEVVAQVWVWENPDIEEG